MFTQKGRILSLVLLLCLGDAFGQVATNGSAGKTRHVNDADIAQLQAALKRTQRLLGPDHFDTLSIASELGQRYVRKGKFYQARKHLSFAIEGLSKKYGANDYRLAGLYVSMSTAYRNTGKPSEAISMARKGLEALEASDEAEDVQICRAQDQLAMGYLEDGQHSQAKDYFEKCLIVYRKHMPKSHFHVAQVCYHLGECHMELSLYDQAENHFKESLEIRKKHSGINSVWTAESLIGLADLYGKQGKYQQAIMMYRDARLSYAPHRKHHRIVTTIDLRIVGMLIEQGKLDQARRIADRCNSKASIGHHRYNPNAIHAKELIARILIRQKRHEEAKVVLQEALASIGDYIPKDHSGRLKLMEEAAKVDDVLGYPEQARQMREKIQDIQTESRQTKRAISVMNDAFEKGRKAMDQDDPQKATELFGLALRMAKKVHGENSTSMFTYHTHLASAYSSYRPSLAIDQYDKALKILKGGNGQNAGQKVRILIELGKLKTPTSVKEATECYQEALEICKKHHRQFPQEEVYILETLGGGSSAVGKYEEADKFYLQAKPIREEFLAKDSEGMASLLIKLAYNCQRLGRLDHAEEYLERGIGYLEKAHGPTAKEILGPLKSLAEIYRQRGSVTQSQSAAGRLVRLLDLQPKDIVNRMEARRLLAGTYKDMEEYGKALETYEAAMKLCEGQYSKYATTAVTVLSEMATLCQIVGAYPRSETLYNKAYTLTKTAYGPDSIQLATARESLADLYAEAGNHSIAASYYLDSFFAYKRLFGEKDHKTVQMKILSAESYLEIQDYQMSRRMLQFALDTLKSDPDIQGAVSLKYEALRVMVKLYLKRGQYVEALSLARRITKETRNLLGQESVDARRSQLLYAETLVLDGEKDKAIGMYKELVKAFLADPATHKDARQAVDKLTEVYAKAGQIDSAYDVYDKVCEEVAGTITHMFVLIDYAAFCAEQNNASRQIRVLAESVRVAENLLGVGNEVAQGLRIKLGTAYEKSGFFAKAEKVYLRTYRSIEEKHGVDSPQLASMLLRLARLYEKQKHWQKVIETAEKGLDVTKGKQGFSGSKGGLHCAMAQALRSQKKLSEAEAHAIMAVKEFSKVAKVKPHSLLESQFLLVQLQVLLKKTEEAKTNLVKAEKHLRSLDVHPIYLSDKLGVSGYYYLLMRDYPSSEFKFIEALSLIDKMDRHADKARAVCYGYLSLLYRQWARPNKAKKWQLKHEGILSTMSRDERSRIVSQVQVLELGAKAVEAVTTTGDDWYEIAEFNCRIRKLDLSWKVASEAKNPSGAKTVFENASLRQTFVLESQRIPEGQDWDSASVVEQVQNHMSKKYQKFQSKRPEKMLVYGIEGVFLDMQSEAAGQVNRHMYWVCVHNGFVYKLMIHRDGKDDREMRSEATILFGRFQVIDPNRPAWPKNYRCDALRMEAKLEGTDAYMWKAGSQMVDASLLSLKLPGDAGVHVLVMLNENAKVTSKPIVDGMVASFGLESNNNLRLINQRAVKSGEMKGQWYYFSVKPAEVEMRYVLRVLQLPGRTVGVVAYCRADIPDGWTSAQKAAMLIDVKEESLAPGFWKKLQPHQVKALAHVTNAVGLQYDTKDEQTSSRCFFKAFELQPDNLVYLKNAVFTLESMGNKAKALECINKSIEHHRQNTEILLLQARLQLECGHVEEALQSYADLHQKKKLNKEQFCAYLDVLANNGKQAEAIEKARCYLATNRSREVDSKLAVLLTCGNKVQEAIAILERLCASGSPGDNEDFLLVSAYIEANEPAKALGKCEEMLKKGVSGAWVHYWKGICLMRLEQYKKSKVSFEQALKLEPGDPDIEGYLRQVSALLGKGKNLVVKTPIKPVPLVEGLVDDLPGITEEYKNEDSYIVFKIKGIDYRKGELTRTTYRKRIKVLTQNGAAAFNSLQLSFDPLSERVFVNEVVVRDSEGKVISKGNVEDYYVLDSPEEGMATHEKTLHMPVAGVVPGCTIDLVATYESTFSDDEFSFVREPIWSMYRTVRQAVYVTGQVENIQYDKVNGVQESRKGKAVVWWADHLAKYRYESKMDDFESFMPIVWIGQKGKDWASEGKEYAKKLSERLTASPQITSLVHRLTSKSVSADDKIRALSQYVRKEVTYKAIEFGIRGRTPNRPEKTLADRYGDCKDHAVLLTCMLQQAGLSAKLVLVNSSLKVRESLPSLDQFNHMIVFVPSKTGGWFIDPTDKFISNSLRVPSGLAGSKALVLDEKKSFISTIQDYPTPANMIRLDRKADIQTNGDVVAEETIEFHGYMAGWMRAILDGKDQQATLSFFQSMAESANRNIRIEDVVVYGRKENGPVLKVQVKYRVGRVLHLVGDTLSGKLPWIWERAYLSVGYIPNRETPFCLRYPLKVATNATISFPQGYEPQKLNDKANKRTRFTMWELDISESNGHARLQFELSRHTGRFDAKQYGEYQDAVNNALEAVERRIVLRQAQEASGERRLKPAG